ncbi:MAG: GGDEF domain-containing protein [Nitrosomonas sp.]|nr:GGDEF domain-containing protein [Nitrosomonas sp.]
MKEDCRIIAYQKAVKAMCRGEPIIKIPTGDDKIGHLGKLLRKLYAHHKKIYSEYQLINKIITENNLNLGLNDTLSHVYDSCKQLVPYDRMSLALLEKNGTVLKIYWVRADYREIKLCTNATIPNTDDMLQEMTNITEPHAINDLSKHSKKYPTSEFAKTITKEKIHSSLTCPLMAIAKPIGFLFFSCRKKNAYKKHHQVFCRNITNLLAIVAEKNKLHKMIRNRSLLIAQKKDLEQRATHDALTGLYNRPAILDIYHKQIARAKRGGFGIAVIMIDIDHFKKINDSCGHPTGDIVLYQIADRLLHCSRSHEYIGRYGGEEFLAILCPYDKTGALKAAERFRSVIAEKAINTDHTVIPITISLGVAVNTGQSILDENTLLQQADDALYTAKNNGRNRVELAINK